jgi:choice-of-anchor C domain-containing protein
MHGAAYITDVVDPASNRFRRQRVMGLWNVEFKQKSTSRKVASAVLAWRRLPNTDPKIAGDIRIGDFYCDGKQYRVNAQLTGNDPLAAYLYIDFRHPQTPAGEARGVRFYAVASLADGKPATMEITQAAANGNVETLFDVPTDDLIASAVQATDENPLLQIPTPNLLVNGSFEEGPSGKPALPQDVGSTAINGWTVTRGPIAYIDSPSWCDLGNRCLELHGRWGNGGVAQTFKTTPGRRYRLTFSLAVAQGMVPEANLVAATAAGQHQLFLFHATDKSAMHTKWSTKQWEFTAIDAATTLEIYALKNRDPDCGAAVDDVRVVPVVR